MLGAAPSSGAAAARLALRLLLLFLVGRVCCSDVPGFRLLRSPAAPISEGLCATLIRPLGYPCSEHTVETEDGFLLAVQRIPHGRLAYKRVPGPPVFLQHGLFQGGDTWFMNSCEESLGFLLADSGFDVWVGNVRGTRWSYGHINFSVHDKKFWDWSWQELAQYDLTAMISYVYSATNSTVSYVGHSQGTIMALAAFTIPDFVEMIDSAALLCPISHLDNLSSKFVLRAVSLHLDQILVNIGIHQLNFRSEIGIEILDLICDGHVDCNDLLSAITGVNCCFNISRMDYYLDYEPHASSTRNLHHLFQSMPYKSYLDDQERDICGLIGNLKYYGSLHPPVFDLADIPGSLPIWMAYGGKDALADVTDVQRTIQELKSQPELLYIDEYGHVDFVMSVRARDDLYGQLVRFLKSRRGIFQQLPNYVDIRLDLQKIAN